MLIDHLFFAINLNENYKVVESGYLASHLKAVDGDNSMFFRIAFTGFQKIVLFMFAQCC